MSHSSNGKITILTLTANPQSTAWLRLDKEISRIDDELTRSHFRDNFELKSKWAVTIDDFYRALLDVRPKIVHFSGHGGGEAGIVFEDESRVVVKDTEGRVVKQEASWAKFLSTEQLVALFKVFAHEGVQCVVLNACMTEEQAIQVSADIDYVIGMNKPIGDEAAVSFAAMFYCALGAGKTIEFAFEIAKTRLIEMKEQETPVLYKRPGLTTELQFIDNYKTTSAVNRYELFETLNRLIPQDLNAVIIILHAPTSILPGRSAAQSDRVDALLEWAASPTGCGLESVQQALDNLLNRQRFT